MKKRIMFICGSMNQTTQMYQIFTHLSNYEYSFSPTKSLPQRREGRASRLFFWIPAKACPRRI
jgi:hypothetical protein